MEATAAAAGEGGSPRFSWAAGRVAEAVSEAEVSAVSEAECRAAAEPDVPGRFANEQYYGFDGKILLFGFRADSLSVFLLRKE